ncbi:MAG: hypothetical protein HRT45_03510 [Bdellovibrionales bacterium]|nr:hypothetical protein [Bdellovibrionales bacterium]
MKSKHTNCTISSLHFLKGKCLAVLCVALTTLTACTKDGLEGLASNDFGLNIAMVSGNSQLGQADKLLDDPLIIQVTSPDGQPANGIDVTFREISETGVLITSPNVVTDSSGFAQTNIRLPVVFGEVSRIQACIEGSATCQVFLVNSDEENNNYRFDLESTNGDTEVAGVGFGFRVSVIFTDTNSVVTSYEETVDLEWTFVTSDSWGGVSPTLLPSVQSCTFVEGVCEIPDGTVTLTDTRTETIIFMGDGNDGLIDVFAHEVTVLESAASDLAITDGLGGPDAGATAIVGTQLYTTDSTDETYYAAITDAVGNYISDMTTGTWSSAEPEIDNNLSTNTGQFTTLSFRDTLPHPGGGYLTVNSPPHGIASTGLLTIDPGDPVGVNVILPGGLSVPAGDEIDFDLEVVDADGNRVGPQFSGPGIQGIHDVEFSFRDYVTGTAPAGGSIPTFNRNFVNPYGETVTISQNFTGGLASSYNEDLIFWDATAVSPVMDIRVFTDDTPFASFSPAGSATFTVTLNSSIYGNLRLGPGADAEPVCKGVYEDGYGQSNFRHYPLHLDGTFDEVLSGSFVSGLRPNCVGLERQAGSGAITIYASVEDKAGNFLENVPATYLATMSGRLASGFFGQFSPEGALTTAVTLTPLTVTNGGIGERWFNFAFTYSGTYGTITVDNNALGQIAPADLYDYRLRVDPPTNWPQALGPNEAPAVGTFNLRVLPVDQFGNQIPEAVTIGNRNLNVTVSNTPGSSPAGTSPVFPSTSTFSALFEFAAGQGNRFSWFNLRLPRAGDAITISVQDVDEPSYQDTMVIRSVAGEVDSLRIYDGDTMINGGTDITNATVSLSTDDRTQFFAQAFDSELNFLDILSTSVDWDDSGNDFPIGSNLQAIVTPATNIFVEGDVPSDGVMRATYTSTSGDLTVTASTGLITISPGAPDYIGVSVPGTVTAGQTFRPTLSVRDDKRNICTQVNGSYFVGLGVRQINASNRENNYYTSPASGNFTFTNGVHALGTSDTFELYSTRGTFQVTAGMNAFNPPDGIDGRSSGIVVEELPFDHIRIDPSDSNMLSGETAYVNVYLEDFYANDITVDPVASYTVTFNITSSLGDEDLVGAQVLDNRNIGNFSSPNQTQIVGDLVNGRARLEVTGTDAGDMTFGLVQPGTPLQGRPDIINSLTIDPLPTITAFRFVPGSAPQAVNSTINPLFPFKVEILDVYGNRITTENSETVALSLSGNTNSLGNYTGARTMDRGEVEFGDLTYTVEDTFVITAYLESDPSFFASATVQTQLGSVNRKVPVLPDQAFVEGAASYAAAVTGVPFSGTASVAVGTPFTVTLRAVDDSFNTVTTYTAPAVLTSSDPYLEITSTSSGQYQNGVASFLVTPRQQGVHTISADSGYINEPSYSFTVTPGPATQLVPILPGQALNEGAPDLTTAIGGGAITQVAGSPYSVTVIATDDYYNQISGYTHPDISLTLNTDPAAPAIANQAITSGGQTTFSVTNYLAIPNHNFTADNASGVNLTANISESQPVQAAAANQYIAVFDGQTYDPGQTSGDYASAVVNSPSFISTDDTLPLKIRAVDTFFNTDTSYSGAVTVTTVDDLRDTDPGAGNFDEGIYDITLSPVLAGNVQTITIVAPAALSSNTPSTYNVSTGAKTHLLVLFDDYQTLEEGHLSLGGAVSDLGVQTVAAGVTLPITVYATDSEYNIINDDSTSISVTPSQTKSSLSFRAPTSSNTLSDGTATYNLRTFLVGSGYNVSVAGAGYAGTPSVNYAISQGPGQKLLVVMPGQSFDPGHESASDAASGTPFTQTQGSNYTLQVDVHATDNFFNQLPTATDLVTLNAPNSNVTSTNPVNLSGGARTFDLYFTSSGTSQTMNATASGFTSVPSKAYNVLDPLLDPTLALSDPNTSNAVYIRQNTVALAITNDTTASYWCVTETAGRPSSGTNDRANCVGGQGSDNNWHTTRPTSFTTTSTQGLKNIYVWTADAANNVNQNAELGTITLDSIKPADPSSILVENPLDPASGFTNVAVVDLSVNLSVDTTEYCWLELPDSVAPSPPSYNNSCWQTKPGSFPVSITLSGPGNKDIHVFSKDIAQNVSNNSDKYDIWYDNANPNFGGSPILGAKGGSDLIANEWLGNTDIPTIEWSSATDATPVTYEVLIRNASLTNVCGTATVTGNQHTFSGCNLTHGDTYTVEITAIDSAGNSATAGNNGFSFEVDTVAPAAGFDVSGLDGGSDTTVDEWLTDVLNDPEITWTDTTGEDEYGVAILFDNNAVACAEVTVTAGTTNFDGFTGCSLLDNTPYKVRLTAYDNAGNATPADNSPYEFDTARGIDNFLVVVNDASVVAGEAFTISVIARRANNEVAESYIGSHTVTIATNGAAGADLCASAINPLVELPPLSLFFSLGRSTTGNMKLKSAATNTFVTATDESGYTGNSGVFTVSADSAFCTQIEDAAGGNQTEVTADSYSIDATATYYASQYDRWGNYLGPDSVNWIGYDSVADAPFPDTATASTTLVGAKAGSGVLSISGGASGASANISVGTGSTNWNTGSTDAYGRSRLGNNNIGALFYWDTSTNTSTTWRTTSGPSWYSESSSANRGDKDRFPERVMLVGTASGLDIVDLTNYTLFMRFQRSSDYAIDANLGSITSIFANNGKVFVGMSNGLMILDFVTDQIYKLTSTNRFLSNRNLSQRNSSGVFSVNTTYPALSNNGVKALHGDTISSVDYLAIGHGAGVDLLRVSGTTTKYADSGANEVVDVYLASNSRLYYLEENSGVRRADLSLPLSANFSESRTYSKSSAAALVSLELNSMHIAEGSSAAQTGRNQILVGTDRGLTVLNEHDTFGSSTANSFGIIGTGYLPFSDYLALESAQSEYLTLADGAGLSGESEATIELRFRPSSSPNSSILFEKGDVTSENGATRLRFDGSGFLTFEIRHNGTLYSVQSSSSSWNTYQWYHVAAVVSSSSISLYVDGSRDDQDSSMNFASPTLSFSSSASSLAGNASGSHFNGNIDEFRVSKSARYSGGGFVVDPSAFTSDGDTVHLLHFNGNLNHSDSGAQQNAAAAGNPGYSAGLFSGTVEVFQAVKAVSASNESSAIISSSTAYHKVTSLETSSPSESIDASLLGIGALEVFHVDSQDNFDSAVGRSSGLHLKRE